MKKSIITGPPFSGKSTLVKLLRNSYPDFEIAELDEKLVELNNGIWPSDEFTRDTVLLPKVFEETLSKGGEFIFFASYISLENIKRAKEGGFTLIQLMCPTEILIKRNTQKDKNRQIEMSKNVAYQKKIERLNLPDIVINCANSPIQVAEELLAALEIHS